VTAAIPNELLPQAPDYACVALNCTERNGAGEGTKFKEARANLMEALSLFF